MFQPKLEIRHLRMLQAMARTGSVTRSAAILGLTQSALSHQIREAERRLGVDLFVQRNRRMHMTPAAQTLNAEAERLLTRLEEMERSVSALAMNGKAVKIGCNAGSCYRWLSRFLKSAREPASDISVEIVADPARHGIEPLLDHTVDLAILSGPQDRTQTRSLRLISDELIVATAPDHPLAARSSVLPQDLAGEVFIVYGQADTLPECSAVLSAAMEVSRGSLRVDLIEAAVELVGSGFGVSMLPRRAIDPYLAAHRIVGLPVTRAGITFDWHAVMRKTETPTGSTARVAEAMRHWCTIHPDGMNGGQIGH